MSKMTEKDLRRRDVKRNIGEELLRAVQELRAGKAGARGHNESDARSPQPTFRRAPAGVAAPKRWLEFLTD